MSHTIKQRKSSRSCRRPDRFIPDASAWTPGSANGILNPTKIDHWQLSFNGHVSESQNEKKSNCNYENAIDLSIKNDKESKQDSAFVVSDHDSDNDSDYESAHSWTPGEESDEEYDDDGGEVECHLCGRRWDGNAQCFPCVYPVESDEEIEEDSLQGHTIIV